MLELLCTIMANNTPDVHPTISSIAVSSVNAGACVNGSKTPSPAASYTVDTTVDNPDWTNWVVKLYGNGLIVTTFTTGGGPFPLVYTRTMGGQTQDGPVMPTPANITYRADVVRISNAQVVSSKTAPEWTQAYGGCSGGPV